MKKKTVLSSALGLTIAAMLLGSGAAQATQSRPDTKPSAPDSGSYVETSMNGVVIESSKTTQAGIGARSLPIVDHLQCAANNANWVIKQYQAAYSGGFQGQVDLKCGDDNSGYKHINQRHSGQWVERTTWHGAAPSSDWDLWLLTYIDVTLRYPSKVISQAGQKSCYEAPFTQQWKNSKGQVLDSRTWYVVVIISQNNRKIITSYPPTNSYC